MSVNICQMLDLFFFATSDSPYVFRLLIRRHRLIKSWLGLLTTISIYHVWIIQVIEIPEVTMEVLCQKRLRHPGTSPPRPY